MVHLNVKIDSMRTPLFLFTQFNILWILELIEFVDVRAVLVEAFFNCSEPFVSRSKIEMFYAIQ